MMMPNTAGTKNFRNLTMKIYLRERGVTVNGHLKATLVEIANAVEKMMLPIDPNFEKEDSTERNVKAV